jgi:glycosyltransferase involved in cell wall biosynthesis
MVSDAGGPVADPLAGLRVTMFVRNPCVHDARVLREAATLAAAGCRVVVVALGAGPAGALPERESRDGFDILRVRPPSAWLRRWTWLRYHPWRARRWLAAEIGASGRTPRALGRSAAIALGVVAASPFVLARALQYVVSGRRSPVARPDMDALDWIVRWRYSVLDWARMAAAAAPEADVYHAHDLNALPAAVQAAGRSGARLIYDSHEIFVDSSSKAGLPRAVRSWLIRQERQMVQSAAALVTVNDDLAAELDRRYRSRRTVVVHNCPPRWSPPDPAPDLFRAALDIPAATRIVLYHGAVAPHRGIEELLAAIVRVPSAAVVVMGEGSLVAKLRERVEDPGLRGRLHLLPPVPPASLLPWVASADVVAVPIQASTINHRLSTPNKLFEAIAAGIPVVASDFGPMRRIVVDGPEGPLGAVCDPADPAALAAAIAGLLDLSEEDRQALRARCRAAAAARWNWETQVAALLALYRELAA